MPDLMPLHPDSTDPLEPVELDEVDEVLAELRQLAARVTIPIIQVCLKDAQDDIAHLLCREGREQAAENLPEAA